MTNPALKPFSFSRVSAIILRHLYLMRSSWVRLIELMYWPLLNVVVWGFISQYFMQHSSVLSQAAGILLGAVLLWDVLFRGQLGVSISFMEEMWSRNFANLFITPLRPYEYLIGILTMSFIRILVCIIPSVILAAVFYHYSIFELGFPLLIFFVHLMVMGWWLGLLICGLLLRLGMGAESLAWASIFMLSPVAGIYYPIATLPEWLQYIAWGLPTAYVFEGMRTIMLQHYVPWDMLAKAALLNGVYLVIGIGGFLTAFHYARRDGQLLQGSE